VPESTENPRDQEVLGLSREQARRMRLVRWVLIRGLFVCLLMAVLEGLSWGGLALLNRLISVEFDPISTSRLRPGHQELIVRLFIEKSLYLRHDPVLGWSIRPSMKLDATRSNADGLRADREYAAVPPPEAIRICCFGDSYTYGSSVATPDSWPAFLERSRKGLEVLNFGVPGYGLDQAFLRYSSQGRRYAGHIVLIGFQTGTLCRNVNTFRPFEHTGTGIPLSKPRFVDGGSRLKLIENPLKTPTDYNRLFAHSREILASLGANDLFFKIRYHDGPMDRLATMRLVKMVCQSWREFSTRSGALAQGIYNVDSEPFRVTTRIMSEFYDSCLEAGSVPILVVLPYGQDIVNYYKHSYKAFSPLTEYLEKHGLQYVDVMDILAQKVRTSGTYFIDQHYAPLTNRLVAEGLSDYMQEHGLSTLEGIRARLAQERTRRLAQSKGCEKDGPRM